MILFSLIWSFGFPFLPLWCGRLVGLCYRPIERKFSEQNLGAPPSYEEAVGVSGTPTYSDRSNLPQLLIHNNSNLQES